MLSEDEKKAIELLENLSEYGLCYNITEEYQENFKTVLKFITKLQKEIDHQKEKRENQKVELAILNEKQKEMNKLKNTVSSYYGMFKKQEKQIKELRKENNQKDKQIDLILSFLEKQDLGYYKKENGGEIIGQYRCYKKDDWKQHFEKLAKEKGE